MNQICVPRSVGRNRRCMLSGKNSYGSHLRLTWIPIKITSIDQFEFLIAGFTKYPAHMWKQEAPLGTVPTESWASEHRIDVGQFCFKSSSLLWWGFQMKGVIQHGSNQNWKSETDGSCSESVQRWCNLCLKTHQRTLPWNPKDAAKAKNHRKGSMAWKALWDQSRW